MLLQWLLEPKAISGSKVHESFPKDIHPHVTCLRWHHFCTDKLGQIHNVSKYWWKVGKKMAISSVIGMKSVSIILLLCSKQAGQKNNVLLVLF